jgi:nuclear pore complex protein Nup133
MPLTGKITYWESIASAATVDLIQQQRTGVEANIPGLFHGETVIQILNAESAGFVLTFSTGRIAYLSVRDSQGRPSISTQILRGANGGGSGGIFGSIRNVLSSSSWRGDLAAARAGPSSAPGERCVVTTTQKGKLQAWSLHRGGHNVLEAEGDAREVAVDEMKRTNRDLSNLDIETFEVLDFAFAPHTAASESSTALAYREGNGTEVFLLASLNAQGVHHYALIQVFLRPTSVMVGTVRHLRAYSSPPARTAVSKPRLYLPSPGSAAFILFDRGVVILSMANDMDSPEAQLLADSHILPPTFEDVIQFRTDAGVEITGSGMEEIHSAVPHGEDSRSKRHKAKFPAVVLLVKGHGVIRVATTDPKKFTAQQPPKVTAKSKLEQAVFFGTLENNPLSFSGREEIQFDAEDYSAAAKEISHEILAATTRYIPSIPASMEQNFRIRAEALKTLATHLKTLQVELDRVTKWKLLWDAEKLAAAAASWEVYDQAVRKKPAGQKRGLWNEIVEYLHDDFKKNPIADDGEVDRVRFYFMHDVWRFELALSSADAALKQLHKVRGVKGEQLLSYIRDAMDLSVASLTAAYEFRVSSLALYGLQDEQMHNGILLNGYGELPEPWTSKDISDDVWDIAQLGAALTAQYYNKERPPKSLDARSFEELRLELPDMVDVGLASTIEHSHWLMSSEDPKMRAEAAQYKEIYIQKAEVIIYNLTDYGLADAAIELTKKHRMMFCLVTVIQEEIGNCHLKIEQHRLGGEDERAQLEAAESRDREMKASIEENMKLFGKEFANSLYSFYCLNDDLYNLLAESRKSREYLTEFLRGDKSNAPVAWINEICTEKNFDEAAKALLDLGLHRERELWAKNVELSIGSLARLAGRNYSEREGLIIPDGGKAELKETRQQLQLIGIQEKLHQHARLASRSAIDEEAALQLTVEVYQNPALKNRKALSMVLQEKLSWLLDHKAMSVLDIVDLLTLMGPGHFPEGEEPVSPIAGEEFWYALQALNVAGPAGKDEFELTERTIWKRCLLRSDWKEINNTEGKGDDQVRRTLERTALYSMVKTAVKKRKSMI